MFFSQILELVSCTLTTVLLNALTNIWHIFIQEMFLPCVAM